MKDEERDMIGFAVQRAVMLRSSVRPPRMLRVATVPWSHSRPNLSGKESCHE